jgi:hypothetical protein
MPGLLSFGKASELDRISRFAFASVLTDRHIARHYGEEELRDDSSYANGDGGADFQTRLFPRTHRDTSRRD